MIAPQHIPVIVSIGECIDRDNLHQPRALLAHAARLAGAEAAGLLQRVDSIDVVSIISFQYDNIGQLLADDLGLSPSRTEESIAGGEKPVRLLVEAAERIVAGTSQVALICGAEATRTRARAAQEKAALDWGPADPHAKQLTALDFVTAHAARYGLVQPTQVYPLYENAARHSWGQSLSQAQQESAQIWSRNADAASRNPNAWIAKQHSAEQIIEASDNNRMIAFPYRKLMVANPMVNQASALLVTSLAQAQATGIAPENIVYIWGGARADEPQDFLVRDRYDRSTAQDAVLNATLQQAGLATDTIDLVELYSCFPIVPKMARRTLNLGQDVPLSLAGGLTFFGGPANNYMGHALVAAVRALRNGQGRNALIYGQGEFVTKHAATVLATTAPTQSPRMLDVQAEADANAGASPQLLESYSGPAVIESFTITYDRSGEPSQAPVVLRTPDGARTVALVPGADAQAIAILCDDARSPIGLGGHVSQAENGLQHFRIEA